MLRRIAGVAVALAVTAACGSGGSGGSDGALAATAGKLSALHSGVLDLRLTAAAGDRAAGEQAGFRLQGPFAQGAKGHLPLADITYTRYEGSGDQVVKVVSTGDHAYVVRNGRSLTLTSAQANELKVSGGSGVDLHLDKWFDKPQITDAGTVDGVPVQRITGRLNVAAALDDLFRISHNFGAADVKAPKIEGDLAKRLEATTQSATAEVITGKNDHFLRHLVADVKLASQAPPQIREALGRLGAVRFHFELGLAQPNKPVHVSAPQQLAQGEAQ